MNVVFVGTAGCGKTLLTRTYSEWLKSSGYKVAVVNLDPGAEVLPYRPDLDIRDYITVDKIMVERGLGPNGALIEASRLMAERIGEILDAQDLSGYDYVLVDTPGQMEMFVFHESGPAVMERLRSIGSTVTVYLVDGAFVRDPVDLLITYFMSILVQLRLTTPTIPVLNKADLVADLDLIDLMLVDPERFAEKALSTGGLLSEVGRDLLGLTLKASASLRLVKASALKGWGMEDLHSIIYEVHCTCGDLS